MRPARQRQIWFADALARFEEDEMIGVVRFGKDDCVRSALCQHAACLQLTL